MSHTTGAKTISKETRLEVQSISDEFRVENSSVDVSEYLRANNVNWSPNIVKWIRSPEEAEIYVKAGLVEGVVNGRPCLLQPDINGDTLKPYSSGVTNLVLTFYGEAPYDSSGQRYELHHIGQDMNSPLAELTAEQHRSIENFSVLHSLDKSSIDRDLFDFERYSHWQSRAATINTNMSIEQFQQSEIDFINERNFSRAGGDDWDRYVRDVNKNYERELN